jgi:exportin-1
MGPPNATWQQIIEQAKQSVEVLKQAEVIRNVQNILQVGALATVGYDWVLCVCVHRGMGLPRNNQ